MFGVSTCSSLSSVLTFKCSQMPSNITTILIFSLNIVVGRMEKLFINFPMTPRLQF